LFLVALPEPTASRVLLCGYYGEHNLGDDALLQVALSQLPAGVIPTVTAYDEGQVHERFGVATVPRRSLRQVLQALQGFDALILGGGSLLQDATSFRSLLYYVVLITAAKLQGKQVLLWGQGLGPLRRRRSQLLARAVLPLADATSWRDQASASLAFGWGVKGLVAPDPVWAMPLQPWRGSQGPLVVCFRPTHQLDSQGWKPYLEALSSLAVKANREVLWLAFHGEQDRGLLAQLRTDGLLDTELKQRSREVLPAHPREAMAVFTSAGLVLAMRLHGLILAALSGSPTVALSYDPKVAAAANGIGCPCQPLDQPVEAKTLLESWTACLYQPPATAHVQALHEQAQQHRIIFEGLGIRLPSTPFEGGPN
jgi:polysaccharide pyruvyl transferase CsaB